MALVVGNQPANAGDIKDTCLIPGSVRSLGGGHGNPLQYSCLEKPMDRRAWRAIVNGVTKSQKRRSMSTRQKMPKMNASRLKDVKHMLDGVFPLRVYTFISVI